MADAGLGFVVADGLGSGCGDGVATALDVAIALETATGGLADWLAAGGLEGEGLDEHAHANAATRSSIRERHMGHLRVTGSSQGGVARDRQLDDAQRRRLCHVLRE
jgi:hypothetical protein